MLQCAGLYIPGVGGPTSVALCYAATLPVAADPAALDRMLRAAVAPHVALQLLPDVRPLLPTLHGFFVSSWTAAENSGRLPGAQPGAGAGAQGDKVAWLVYSMHGQCLALHLAQQPQNSLAPKVVVRLSTLISQHSFPLKYVPVSDWWRTRESSWLVKGRCRNMCLYHSQQVPACEFAPRDNRTSAICVLA